MHSKQKNTPRLRFTEYTSPWIVNKLGELSDVRDGTHDSPSYTKKGYPLITSKNLTSDGTIRFDDINLISKTDYENINRRSKVNKGDILFGMIGTIGNPVIVEQDGFAIKNVALIKEKEKLKNRFLFQYLKTKYIAKQFYLKNTGGTQKFIALGVIRDLDIPIPVIKEQQKIADFLSTVDKWIQNLKSQKEELEKYKKGMMQKIFSQEIRFKDDNGNDFPDWKKIKLGELIEEVSEKTTINNQYQILSSTKDDIFMQKEYFNRQIASKNNIGYKILKRDQLVFSPQNIWLGNINLNTKYDIGIVSPSYKIFDIKTNLSLTNYVKYIIKLPRMLYEYEISSEQGASVVRRNLNMEMFKSIPVLLPSIKEQQKIAIFLMKLEELITHKFKEIELSERWKEGLMQEMFV